MGKFNVSGIHIHKGGVLYLPSVPKAGEFKEEIVYQAVLGYEILVSACDCPKDVGDLYNHTDFTGHN